MSFISLASGKSLWRGYEYFKENRVYNKSYNSAYEIEGKVVGNGQTYTVNINIEHPRSSKCNCPHANGRRIICKHMVALYFTEFPQEAENYYNEVIAYEEEQERLQEEMDEKIAKYINSLTKNELRQKLYEMLYDGPEWVFERFYRENIEW